MRMCFLLAAALALTGCVSHRQTTHAQLQDQRRFLRVAIDSVYDYLIDPRTESCFLREQGAAHNFALVPVPCDKLKRNVPEAAPHITWDADAPAPTP
jgi:hypothetical protein